jgi:Tfp pilus assembly protein PilP
MKLIQILALTAAMATMATAQNAGGGNPQAGKPAGTATPAKSSPTTTKTGVAAQNSKAGTAKGPTAKAAATPAPAGKTASGGAGKAPASTTQAAKSAAATTKTGATKGAVTKTGAAPQVAAKPPVPAAKGGKKAVMTAAPKTKKAAKGVAVSAKKTKPAKPKVAEVPPPEKAEKKKPAPRLLGAAGRRDPFVSPIRVSVGAQGPGSGCTQGKRCLAIPELVLRGTVRDITGKMLAVVSNSAQRTYTLRENDQVFNGSVEKITSDSIIFREFVKDALGRETAREVVKKLGPTS